MGREQQEERGCRGAAGGANGAPHHVKDVRRWGLLSRCCRLFDLDPDLLPLFQYNCKQFASPQECLSAPEFLDHVRKVRAGQEKASGQGLGFGMGWEHAAGLLSPQNWERSDADVTLRELVHRGSQTQHSRSPPSPEEQPGRERAQLWLADAFVTL